MRKLIAGNWKMNGELDDLVALARDIVKQIQETSQVLEKCDFLVCPPSLYIGPVQTELTQAVSLGAQDCSPFDFEEDGGAYTGDISASMLRDMNCDFIILGHSERRHFYKESNLLIQKKAQTAHKNGLKTIICVGESEREREEGRHEERVLQQVVESLPQSARPQNTILAYEPVWAIGTGKTPTIEEIIAMHGFILETLKKNRAEESGEWQILYGGSVKPENAEEILGAAFVGGALIGGASLKADDFLGIAKAA